MSDNGYSRDRDRHRRDDRDRGSGRRLEDRGSRSDRDGGRGSEGDRYGSNGRGGSGNGNDYGDNGNYGRGEGHFRGGEGHYRGGEGHYRGGEGHYRGGEGHLRGDEGHYRGNGASDRASRPPSRPMAGRGRVAPSSVRDGPYLPPLDVDADVNRSRSPQQFESAVPGEASKRQRDDGNRGNGGEQPGPSGFGGGGGPRDEGGDGGRGRGRGGPGRGRGRGRGGGGEGRGGARRGRREEEFDMVQSRPKDAQGQLMTKRAVLGNSRPIALDGNFFTVECKPDWCIFHYRVDFLPDEPDTRMKKKLLRVHSKSLGAYVFDGSSLYTSNRLSPDPMSLCSMRDTDQEKIELNVRLVAQLAPTDIMYLQLLNIIVRKCMETLELEEMGRHFYDRHQAIRLEAHRLELWPGFKTSMRNYENGILFNVEITHKVLRLDTCLHEIQNKLHKFRNDQEAVKNGIVGNIVMTIYNRKTYRVDDIDWETTPLSTFDFKERKITFMDYFQERYNIRINDSRQPMLVSRPKKRDFHRGMTGPIMLIPELCQMTGIDDEMRENNNLMRAIAQHLHTDPVRRVEKLKEFIGRMNGTREVQDELKRWGMKFQNRLVNFEGHTIQNETILFGDKKSQIPNDKYDWGGAFRDKPLLKVVNLRSWVVIVPSRFADTVDKLLNTMNRVATPLRFQISRPLDICRLGNINPNDYAKAVDTVMNQHRDKLQMVFVILPRQQVDTYSAVKKRACLEFGVLSQCFVAKNAQNDKGLMSICTKLVVQMAAKLGGEPWTVQFPLSKLMIIGFDVYHCGKRRGSSVGAMVATTSATQASYFSCTSTHESRDDLSENMGADFRKCLQAYVKINGDLPERIMMYRDGVGDGQLQYVYETELSTIKAALVELYTPKGRDLPKFTFIVVTKRINTRMFAMDGRRHVNPPPGTVADDVITLPERYDFYLVSQHARQGTVSPVSYNVLEDSSGLDANKMQRLTFKLCHMYFNWSGTVTVPAPCQYAHKLAYLTGTALGGNAHERLSNYLYYL